LDLRAKEGKGKWNSAFLALPLLRISVRRSRLYLPTVTWPFMSMGRSHSRMW